MSSIQEDIMIEISHTINRCWKSEKLIINLHLRKMENKISSIKENYFIEISQCALKLGFLPKKILKSLHQNLFRHCIEDVKHCCTHAIENALMSCLDIYIVIRTQVC